jgi:uncharacterized protein (UPF0335 family)
MKESFRGYYSLRDEELDRIWDEGLFVLDTNALLNLFRYTESTRTEFLAILSAIVEKLWIPHQIGLEFQRRRLDVIEDQTKAYEDLDKAIDAGKNSVNKALQGFRHHPSLDKTAITEILDRSMQSVSDAINQSRQEYETRVEDGQENELIFDAISDLYASRVGPSFDAETLKNIYAEGAIRYEAKIPPGYEDKSKPEPDRYGDLVLWRQLLAYVATERRPALFITDDGKDDWWRRVKGKIQGPRIELVDEYFEASGERVHFYAPERFLEFARRKLGGIVSEHSLNEVQEVSRELPRRDTNSLFAERALLQSLRNQLEKSMLFPPPATPSARDENPRTGQFVNRMEELSRRKHEIEAQLRVASDALEGLEDGGVRLSILDRRRRLATDLTHLNAELATTIEAFETFQHLDWSDYSSRDGTADESRAKKELRDIIDRIRDIDMDIARRV